MSKDFLNKSYTDDQIEQYVSGNLSKDDMHEFEKYIANDPMLADALEGFLNSNKTSSTQIIAEIKERLNTINKKSKVVVLNKSWEAIAAVFVLTLFSIAYFLLPAKQGNIPFAKDIKDSTTNNTNVTIVPNDVDSINQGMQKIPSTTEKVTLNRKQRKKGDANQIQLKDNSNNLAQNKISKDNKNFSFKGFEIKGTVTDQQGKFIPGVSVFTKGKLIYTRTDIRGQFNFHSMDSVVETNIEKNGFFKKIIKLQTKNANIVKLKKSLP